MVEERRAHPRLRAYHPVRLYLGNSPSVVETLTKDLALGGLRSISATVIPVSTEVRIELLLSSGVEPLSVRGRAVWFRTIPDSNQFEVGIAFAGISEPDKRRLSAYLDRAPR